MNKSILSIDIGASNTKLFINHKNSYKEIYNFNDYSKFENNNHIWDIDKIIYNINVGIKIAINRYPNLKYVTTCSWGLDYILFDYNNKIIKPCYGYRDKRYEEGYNLLLSKMSLEKLFEINGTQNLKFNSIYQLASETKERLEKTKFILNISDAINYLLSGNPKSERSILSTTGLLDIKTFNLSQRILEICQVKNKFCSLVNPGYNLGKLINHKNINVICGFSHDTAAAVNAIDNFSDKDMFISCGTWSLLGTIISKPILSSKVMQYNFTNEIQNKKIRMLKNIVGLWIMQELERELNISESELTDKALNINKKSNIIDISQEKFYKPGNMIKKIKDEYFKKYNILLSDDIGFIVKIVLDSLINIYKENIYYLEEIIRKNFHKLHIIGGGVKNKYLIKNLKKKIDKEIIIHSDLNSSIGNIKLINKII